MGLVLLTAGPRRSRGASGPPPPVRSGRRWVAWESPRDRVRQSKMVMETDQRLDGSVYL